MNTSTCSLNTINNKNNANKKEDNDEFILKKSQTFAQKNPNSKNLSIPQKEVKQDTNNSKDTQKKEEPIKKETTPKKEETPEMKELSRKSLVKTKKKVQIVVDNDNNSNKKNILKLNLSNDENSDCNVIERERKERSQTEKRENK